MSAKNDYLALKDILFGRESTILENVKTLVASHDQQIGSPERLKESVAEILAGALRSAGVKDRPGLALSIAPVIIDGIRSEIRNSRNEIVDALYPIMGRLTSAYVLSVFRDFTEETNRRLEGGLSGRFIWLRLYCLLTGQSYAKRLLRMKTAFRVQEIMMIDADTGALIDSWQAPDLYASERSIAEEGPRVTGMIAAVNKFAAEALKAKRQSLKSIDLGDSQIYLRMTAKLLFAVRCEGYARSALLNTLDKTIVDILEVYEPLLSSRDEHTATQSAREALVTLAERIQTSLMRSRRRPVFAIALYGALAVAFLAYVGWSQWQSRHIDGIRNAAQEAVKTYPGLSGYPITIVYDQRQNALVVTGLVPSYDIKSGLESRLQGKIRELPVQSMLLVLPDARKLEQAQADIHDVAQSAKASLASIEASLKDQRETLRALSAETFSPEHLFTGWAAKNAIFFAEGATFRNPGMAQRQLEELSKIMGAGSFTILIIGFTDSLGQSKGNEQLGMERAKAAADGLIKLGVPASRLTLASRREEALVTRDTGPASNNRRVEFRLNFVSEPPN
jgi:outer membrane protein OmpA-like peptidoglycan-associated protein